LPSSEVRYERATSLGAGGKGTPTVKSATSPVRLHSHPRQSRVLLFSGRRYALRAGETRLIGLRLRRRARELLARYHRLRVRADVRVAGGRRVSRSVILLGSARHSHGKRLP